MSSYLFFVFIFLSSSVFAAVPPQLNKEEKSTNPWLFTALQLPLKNRILALNRQEKSFQGLAEIAFNHVIPMELRWRALTALPMLDSERAKPYLEKALEHSEWFMRNAALLGLKSYDSEFSLHWSLKLLKDPALVVRTAAVDNLAELKDRRAHEPLIKALNAPINFKGTQSLWVRHHIAKALSFTARVGEEHLFEKLLRDPDERLHPWAVKGLERLTGQKMPAPNLP